MAAKKRFSRERSEFFCLRQSPTLCPGGGKQCSLLDALPGLSDPLLEASLHCFSDSCSQFCSLLSAGDEVSVGLPNSQPTSKSFSTQGAEAGH